MPQATQHSVFITSILYSLLNLFSILLIFDLAVDGEGLRLGLQHKIVRNEGLNKCTGHPAADKYDRYEDV